MSSVEDTRQAIQDFIAPDLKAIAVRLDALDKDVKTGFEARKRCSITNWGGMTPSSIG